MIIKVQRERLAGALLLWVGTTRIWCQKKDWRLEARDRLPPVEPGHQTTTAAAIPLTDTIIQETSSLADLQCHRHEEGYHQMPLAEQSRPLSSNDYSVRIVAMACHAHGCEERQCSVSKVLMEWVWKVKIALAPLWMTSSLAVVGLP
jgi:hypothetical protein